MADKKNKNNNENENENVFSDEDLIVLKDEDGKEIEFVQIATIDYEGEWYAFLQPTELGDLEDDEMILFKIETDEEGEDFFVPVEDEDLTNKVYEEYVKEYEAETEYCDGDCSMCSEENCEDREDK
jgi:uncharacterized protein YrzB (UPF0473 family)